MNKKILFGLILIPGIIWADSFTYDGLRVGMSLNKIRLAGYSECEPDPAISKTWLSCTSNKKFFPPFQNYNIDDVEVELQDGKTVMAINLITGNNVVAADLAKELNGKVTNKDKLSLITIPNHEDSLVVIKGKIAIMNNNPR